MPTLAYRAAMSRAYIIEINEHYVQREKVTAFRSRLDRFNVERPSTPVLTLEFYAPDYATARSSLHPLPAESIYACQNATSPDAKRRDSRIDVSSIINNTILLSRRSSWIFKRLPTISLTFRSMIKRQRRMISHRVGETNKDGINRREY